MAEESTAERTSGRLTRAGSDELEASRAAQAGADFDWHFGRVTSLGTIEMGGSAGGRKPHPMCADTPIDFPRVRASLLPWLHSNDFGHLHYRKKTANNVCNPSYGLKSTRRPERLDV